MSGKIIDINDKLETKKMIAELRETLERVEKDPQFEDPKVRSAVLYELHKGIFRLELLQQVLEHGYDPKEFLINPNDKDIL